MTVTSTITITAPIVNVSPAHDQAWWAIEAVHACTDWPGVVDAAFRMLITAGIIEQPAAETLTLWDTSSWRDSAVEYHRNRPRCLAVEIEPKRLARLRGLMVDGVSPELCDFRAGISR